MIELRRAGIAVLIVGGLALSAAAPVAGPSALLPLSAADTGRIKEAGCIFSFEAGAGKTMFYSVETVMMMRTKAGLSQCRIPERAMGAFREAKGPVTCGGQRLSLRQAGKLIEPAEGSEEDGTSYPAILTVGSGPGARTWKGEAATAC